MNQENLIYIKIYDNIVTYIYENIVTIS